MDSRDCSDVCGQGPFCVFVWCCVCSHVCKCVEARDIKCLVSVTLHPYAKAGSLTEPRVCPFCWSNQPASPEMPCLHLLSPGVMGKLLCPILCGCWGPELVSSGLYGKPCTHRGTFPFGQTPPSVWCSFGRLYSFR